jgi:hypothetical protein
LETQGKAGSSGDPGGPANFFYPALPGKRGNLGDAENNITVATLYNED